MTARLDLTTAETRMIIRSACHTLADSATPPATTLRAGITDHDLARLMLALEMGQVIVPAERTWKVLDARPTLMPFIPRLYGTILEAMRIGLVYPDVVRTGPGIVRTQLVGAAVHLRRSVGETVCPASHDIPFVRYRLVDSPEFADCTACLAMDR